jgi:hypothetical protein
MSSKPQWVTEPQQPGCAPIRAEIRRPAAETPSWGADASTAPARAGLPGRGRHRVATPAPGRHRTGAARSRLFLDHVPTGSGDGGLRRDSTNDAADVSLRRTRSSSSTVTSIPPQRQALAPSSSRNRLSAAARSGPRPEIHAFHNGSPGRPRCPWHGEFTRLRSAADIYASCRLPALTWRVARQG